MAFNINRFSSEVASGGFALSSNFEVIVSRPSNIGGTIAANALQDNLRFRTEMFEIPGRRVNTTEVRYAGPRRLIGYDVGPTEVQFNILVSEDLREKVFFEEWQDAIVGNHRTGAQSQSMYDLGFYDSYAKNALVTVNTYSVTGERTHETILYEAYPVHVGSLSSTWTDTNMLRMTVGLAYRYYVNKIVSTGTS